MIVRLALILTLLALPVAAVAQDKSSRAATERPMLPAAAVTHLTVELPGRALHFTATAAALAVPNDS